MKRFYVTFTDVFEADSEEDVIQQLLAYLGDVVVFTDVTAFDIGEIK